MSIFIKICGITSTEAAIASVSAGANALGFVFAESARRLTPARATQIVDEIPAEVERVAVFLRPTIGEIESVLDRFDADTVQADAGSLVGFDRVPVLPVIRDGHWLPPRGRLLFEGARSGVGEAADWTTARLLARTRPLILAGGLDQHNVSEAIRSVRPHGVDVSSGVETGPGVKSPDLILGFIEAVREAEKAKVTP